MDALGFVRRVVVRIGQGSERLGRGLKGQSINNPLVFGVVRSGKHGRSDAENGRERKGLACSTKAGRRDALLGKPID